MSLNETFMQKLEDWQPPGGGRQTLSIPDADAGWAVSVTADRNDEIGCLAWEIEAERTTASFAGSVRDWAERVASRVTGLLEPLVVIEVDLIRDEALLRSEEPSPRASGVAYYEALLRGTRSATFRRVRAFPGGSHRREQIPFTITHEALAKLAGDLATS